MVIENICWWFVIFRKSLLSKTLRAKFRDHWFHKSLTYVSFKKSRNVADTWLKVEIILKVFIIPFIWFSFNGVEEMSLSLDKAGPQFNGTKGNHGDFILLQL